MPLQTLKPASLRAWLFLLGLAAMLPPVLFAAYTVREYDRIASSALLADLRHRSHDLQRAAEHMVLGTVAALESMADSDSAQRGDWPALHAHARLVVSHASVMRAVTLVDSAGDVRFHTGRPYGETLFPAHEPALAEAALRAGRISVSSAFKAPISPLPVIAVSVPLRQGSQVSHVLRAIVLTETLDRLLAAAALPEGWVAGITDAHGTLLARSAGAEQYVGRPAAPSFFEGMRRGDGQPFQGSTLEGVPTTIMVLPVHGGDWYLGVAVPDTVLSAPRDAANRRIALFAALWLALAFAVSYLFGSYLARQARLLVEAVARPGLAAPGAVAGLRVHEFVQLLDSATDAHGREARAVDTAARVRMQRDEVFDLYDNAPCGYHSLDAEGRVQRMNATELAWLGYRWDEVRGRPITDLFDADSRLRFAETFPRFLRDGHIENVELVLLRKDGSSLPTSISATAVKDADGRMTSSRSTVFDITERKQLEARLEQLARTDTLTGLSNRRGFEERAGQELQRRQAHGQPLAVLMFDIDHFKRVNDQHGHGGGDQVLQQMAAAGLAVLRQGDLLARVGGEEFAVLLPETPAPRAMEVAERLRQTVATTSVVLQEGATVRFTVSVGVAVCEAGATGIEATVKRADAALYAAKAAGRNQVRLNEERQAAEPGSTRAPG